MEDHKLIRLNIQIGGRSFPVKVEETEVDELKEIEKKINVKLNEFMVKFPGYDRLDLITMTFLDLIFEINKDRLGKTTLVLEKRLNEIASMLESSL